MLFQLIERKPGYRDEPLGHEVVGTHRDERAPLLISLFPMRRLARRKALV